MSASRFLRFLCIGFASLTGFALLWSWLAPYYGQAQIALLQLWIDPALRLSLDQDGIAVHRQEELVMRRDYLSFGGVGLTIALWLAPLRLRWRERWSGLALGWGLLFMAHLFLFIGLLTFAQTVLEERATGWQTLLYSLIAVSDWVIPFLIWAFLVLFLRFRSHPVERNFTP